MITVEHGSGPKPIRTEVSTIVDLDALLDRLAAESPPPAPYLANVIRSNGDSLTIGLGAPLLVDEAGELLPGSFEEPLTVLSFVGRGGDPPYYASRASAPASHNFIFFAFGHWTEFQGLHAIPVAVARQGLRDFVSSTKLPASVQWEEV
jgi:hypothetical protein